MGVLVDLILILWYVLRARSRREGGESACDSVEQGTMAECPRLLAITVVPSDSETDARICELDIDA
jgi:hypothetical protein